MNYIPNEADKEEALKFLIESEPDLQEAMHQVGHIMTDHDELLDRMCKFAAFCLKDFCIGIHERMEEEWEKSPEHEHGGVTIPELFEFHVIRNLK